MEQIIREENIILLCQVIEKIDFKIYATKGTAEFLKKFSIGVQIIKKVNEGSPHIVNFIEKNKIHLIINTTSGAKSIADSLSIRRTALSKKIPYFTTISAAKIAITGLNIVNNSEISVKSIQELYNLQNLICNRNNII